MTAHGPAALTGQIMLSFIFKNINVFASSSGALKLEKDDIYCYLVQTAVLDYQN